jgi:hypothetical protein
MWVKNEKSWILGIGIMSMQQSTVLCFTGLDLVYAAYAYEGILICNLDLFYYLVVLQHRSRQAAW